MSIGVAGKTLLESLSVEVEAGDIMAFRGASGLGKSTLLRTLAGLVPAVAGELSLGGVSPDELGWPLFRRRVGFLAQRATVIDGTVAENLALPFRYRSAAGASLDAKRARTLLARLGLDGDELWDRRARDLSEGEKQRLCLIRALLVDPDVLLLDEPTSALDPASTRAVERELGRFLERAAVLLVSHDPHQVERLGARVVDLDVLAPAGRRRAGEDGSADGSAERGDG
jgi:putative ABC transport system ATP-binding protein